jgi:hypothetical protein
LNKKRSRRAESIILFKRIRVMKRIAKFSSVLALGALIGSASFTAPASAHGWGGGWHGAGGWHGGWHGGGWGWGGFGIGLGYGLAFAPGYYYAPPVYYNAPPVYYAPPPAYYAPPPYYYQPYPIQAAPAPAPGPASARPAAVPKASAGGAPQSCNAGSYVCPMEVAVPAGARCYCPGNDGNLAYGSAQ